MEQHKVLELNIPAGHGRLRIAKRENDYVFLVCHSETYHEPQSTIPKDEEFASVPILAIPFTDARSVDAYIGVLSKLSQIMKEEQK